MDKGLREAARSVRPYLDEMLGAVLAAEVDATLARLFARAADGQDVEEPLRTVLEQHPATSVFMERVLDDAPQFRPPQVLSETTRGYSGLPGHPSPIAADKFCCPSEDFVWYQAEVGMRVPRCPTHDCLLVPAPRA